MSVACGLSPSNSVSTSHFKSLSTGGYAFFGECLKWFPSPSQHAYVVFPEFLYHPKPVEGEGSWTRMSQWTSLAGQQRELFYVDADSIIYAGTFFCHAGPRAVKVDEAVDEADVSSRNLTVALSLYPF